MSNKYYVRHIRIVDWQTGYENKIRKPIKSYLYVHDGNNMYNYELNKHYTTTKNIYTLYTPIECEEPDEWELDKYVEYYNEVYPIKVSLNELIELTKKINVLYHESEKVDNTLYGDKYDNTEPNAYNCFTILPNNKYEYFKEHRTRWPHSSTRKHNIVIGLYTYDEIENKYKFVKYSLYNKLNDMYYVYEL